MQAMNLDIINWPPPGTYVLAVSGGVDSMVLLDVFSNVSQQKKYKLIVAHFDHKMRKDSHQDATFVENAASAYTLEIRVGTPEKKLLNEATARSARYAFLHQIAANNQAAGIITAHHQDDLLETAILNMLRGTGRHGLSSLQNRSDIIRPLLAIPKIDILNYAQNRDLVWHEDSTNQDETYMRNYVRRRIIPRLDESARSKFVSIIEQNYQINQALDSELINQLHFQQKAHTIDKTWFAGLPHAVAREVMAMWLREHGLRSFDRRTLERLTVHAKTQASGQSINVFKNHWLRIHGDHLALARDEV